MRGKAFSEFFNFVSSGITPAYAGKSSKPIPKEAERIGSPPPMRGKAAFVAFNIVTIRITPAYAGKSKTSCSPAYRVRDHPRLCGEKASPLVRAYSISGSPPPMRGKVAVLCYGYASTGITPAYAGKRLTSCGTAVLVKDHPRLCGEKTKKILKQRYFFHQPASFSFSLQYT